MFIVILFALVAYEEENRNGPKFIVETGKGKISVGDSGLDGRLELSRLLRGLCATHT
jgi:hypothetical protein